jgi:hypothetical protein
MIIDTETGQRTTLTTFTIKGFARAVDVDAPIRTTAEVQRPLMIEGEVISD